MNAVGTFQHLEDIEIPDIEITEGWAVSDVKTIEDCDDAFAVLTAACAAIECQIEVEGFRPLAEQRGAWVASAKAALRFKKGALAIVQAKRGAINKAAEWAAINSADRELLAFIRSNVSPKQWLEWVTAHNAAPVRERAA